ncbi:BppU family phage baseplate upper protein [Pediococcus acidilactici]|uniref:BppU family phage baseplate upper protein n=1 Tax=Pediococcus acidilactici TaxID=1254 RepID=UPI002FBE68CB
MEVMTFNIDKDRRNLVDDKQNYNIDFHDSKYNWLQARQYEESMRQVEVHVVHGDGSPVDLTGVNPVFEGWLPEGLYRIIDAKHSVMVDAQNGIFRFDFPAPAFQIAGSYKQAFFRLMKDGKSVTTLEFSLDVMADKVISGLVPSDYITPFEDLYNNLKDYVTKSNGDFDTAMTQWKKDVADLITELNADVSGINLTITEIKAQLSALEDKIKADNLVTVADLKNLLAPFNDILDSFNNYKGLNNPWLTNVSQSIQTAVNNYASTINSDDGVVRILNLQDIHLTGSRTSDPGYVLGGHAVMKQIHALSLIRDKVDMAVVNGDNADGHESKSMNLHRNQEIVNTIHAVLGNKPTLLTLGNHDDGSVWLDGQDVLTLDELTDVYDYPYYSAGESRPEPNATYSYYDFNDAKIRVISLSGFENPDLYNEDGTLKYKRANNSVFTAKQLNWLVQALKIDSSWSVIIFNHSPYEGFYNNLPYSTMTNINHNVLKDILKAFVDGTKVTSVGANTDFPANITADFSEQGKGTLITNVFGHEHRDADKVVIDDIPAIQRTCDIATTSDRVIGTTSEFALDVIEINPAKRNIKFNRFGSGSSVQWTY